MNEKEKFLQTLNTTESVATDTAWGNFVQSRKHIANMSFARGCQVSAVYGNDRQNTQSGPPWAQPPSMRQQLIPEQEQQQQLPPPPPAVAQKPADDASNCNTQAPLPPSPSWTPPKYRYIRVPIEDAKGEEMEDQHHHQQQQQYAEYDDFERDTDFPGTFIGIPKHVFKIRETTKLILFAGLAVLLVVALDMSTKMISSAAAVACSKKKGGGGSDV